MSEEYPSTVTFLGPGEESHVWRVSVWNPRAFLPFQLLYSSWISLPRLTSYLGYWICIFEVNFYCIDIFYCISGTFLSRLSAVSVCKISPFSALWKTVVTLLIYTGQINKGLQSETNRVAVQVSVCDILEYLQSVRNSADLSKYQLV